VTRAALLRDAADGIRIKVCCIGSIDEAALALEAGADALGLVSAMPSGPGVIADTDIATIANWIGSRAATVLLTSRRSIDTIDEQLTQSHPSVLQLVDPLSDANMAALRRRHPNTVLMPVVHVQSTSSIDEAIRLSVNADAILLDSGNPTATIRELGGTGRVHDWQVSRAIRDALKLPVFLAGGLRVENVAKAIRTVRPFGVDVCSGVRRDGKLDRATLLAFIDAAHAAG
jgi:phosphoribosylanthranilate isomerase